jgi:hypothetical protein
MTALGLARAASAGREHGYEIERIAASALDAWHEVPAISG